MGKKQVEVKAVAELVNLEKNQMWDLFSKYYDDISQDKFLDDLSNKQKVLIFKYNGIVKGFSTLIVYPIEFRGKKIRVLFTGDTIKDRAFWGDKTMNHGFSKFLMQEWLANPLTPFYWFLISKGYKTYLFATKNLIQFWPRYDQQTPDSVTALIRHLAIERYGDAYVEGRGVLKFSEKMGKLLADVAPLTESEMAIPEISYFVEKNPGHAEGDELCCVGKINSALFLHGFISEFKKQIFAFWQVKPVRVALSVLLAFSIIYLGKTTLKDAAAKSSNKVIKTASALLIEN